MADADARADRPAKLDPRPLLERPDLSPRDRGRIGRAVAALLGWWLLAIAAVVALVVWVLIRRGRRLVANLDPPRAVHLPEIPDRTRPS